VIAASVGAGREWSHIFTDMVPHAVADAAMFISIRIDPSVAESHLLIARHRLHSFRPNCPNAVTEE